MGAVPPPCCLQLIINNHYSKNLPQTAYLCSPFLNNFINKKQGNEQLRIDGDFYPCSE